MNTNDPLNALLGGPRICEPMPRIECHSGQHGASKVVVRIADDEGRNWELAFPGLVEDIEEEYRS